MSLIKHISARFSWEKWLEIGDTFPLHTGRLLLGHAHIANFAQNSQFPAEMAGGCEGAIRRIDIFGRRFQPSQAPVPRMAPVCPPLHFGGAISVDLREHTAAEKLSHKSQVQCKDEYIFTAETQRGQRTQRPLNRQDIKLSGGRMDLAYRPHPNPCP